MSSGEYKTWDEIEAAYMAASQADSLDTMMCLNTLSIIQIAKSKGVVLDYIQYYKNDLNTITFNVKREEDNCLVVTNLSMWNDGTLILSFGSFFKRKWEVLARVLLLPKFSRIFNHKNFAPTEVNADMISDIIDATLGNKGNSSLFSQYPDQRVPVIKFHKFFAKYVKCYSNTKKDSFFSKFFKKIQK